MSKKKRILIKLVSSMNTGTFYVTRKNKNISQKKLNIKKYDKKIRKRVLFHEVKIK